MGDELRVKAVTSVPRLGFNDHFGAVSYALGAFGIPLSWYTSAFWEKAIETAFEDCLFGFSRSNPSRPKWLDMVKNATRPDGTVETKCDIILSLDYDTLCTPQHIATLIHEMQERPEIDALASYQPRRGTGAALCGIKGFEGDMPTNGPFQVDHAAFGLTAIRAKSLVNLPKPWFWAVPYEQSPQNRADFVDPDIFFWAKWKKEGRTAFVHPNVCIGHLEGMVSLFEDVEEPSLVDSLKQKQAEVDALVEQIQRSTVEESNEKRLVLKSKFIRPQEWRDRYGHPGSGQSLEEREEKLS